MTRVATVKEEPLPIGSDERRVAEVLRECDVTEVRHGDHSVRILVSPGGYQPDTWTKMLLTGVQRTLRNIGRPPQLAVEVGVGTGVLPLFLAHWAPACDYLGLDVSAEACESARLNLEIHGRPLPYELLSGGSALDALPADRWGSVDLLAANLPQVPSSDRCNRNDYYPFSPQGEDDVVGHSGLGLVCEVLRQAKSVLSTDGRAVFTVAGRCGDALSESALRETGMTCEGLKTVRVAQDPGTSIRVFAEVEERSPARFQFYPSRRATRPIGACAAVRRLEAGERVYHDLHVISAQPC
jgi:methylase of polypeptide subunit release factors